MTRPRPSPSFGAHAARALPSPVVCTLVLALAAGFAHADEPNPYYIGVSQGVTGDTNVARAAEGRRISRDLISSTELSAGIDQPLGRGRLAADLLLSANRFKNFSQFNNSGHAIRANLEWETLYRISGDLSAYDRQSLYRNEPGSNAVASGVNERDLLRASGAGFRARMGLVTLWTLEGGYNYDRASHSSQALASNDLTQHSVNAGVRLRPSSLWSVRLGGRKTDGRYPNIVDTNGVQQGDDLERDDIDLSATWMPTGNSQLDARVSSTHQTHSLLQPKDARFVTGLVGYDWAPSGKSKLRLQWSRDSAVGSTDQNFNTVTSLTSSSNTGINNNVLLRATWEATAKIKLDAAYAHVRRDQEADNTVGGVMLSTSETDDRSDNISLGITYQATRAIGLGCRLVHDDRRINSTLTNVATQATAENTDRYKYSTGTCSAQIRFQ
ncbi:MAG: hypothetical protein RLZZ618_1791 [Pseudomonadota bacterium]|jgi:hypothetical protein